ncbi:SAM-dependent methyltransferase [Nocardia pneumoniae]|uniref:SAM-dependent methyltransferase n=1 Tax=Nocardia pneumoniae TaxID=228601 RepID=UPI0002E4D80F|nr:class I SAM-dependent methyltransferase [Nocardia pneumoniae]
MAVDQRFNWIVRTMDVRPADRVLEIGPGSSESIACLAAKVTDGTIVGVERSATAIARARKKHAAELDSGRVRLVHAELTSVDPDRLLFEIGPEARRFDKILAVNVNLFWTKKPSAELALIRRLLAPGGTLCLYYGYGTADAPEPTSPKPAPGKLTEYLTEADFDVRLISSGDLLGLICSV